MEPFGIILAVSEAGLRVVQLITKLRKNLDATEQIDTLRKDIERLSFIIEAASTLRMASGPELALQLEGIIQESRQLLDSAKRLLNECEGISSVKTAKARIRIIRKWMKKKDRIEALKNRLGNILF